MSLDRWSVATCMRKRRYRDYNHAKKVNYHERIDEGTAPKYVDPRSNRGTGVAAGGFCGG